jgi:hypothetical protein
VTGTNNILTIKLKRIIFHSVAVQQSAMHISSTTKTPSCLQQKIVEPSFFFWHWFFFVFVSRTPQIKMTLVGKSMQCDGIVEKQYRYIIIDTHTLEVQGERIHGGFRTLIFFTRVPGVSGSAMTPVSLVDIDSI